MRKEVKFQDWGFVAYDEGLEKQQLLFDKLIGQKKYAEFTRDNYLIFCEHPPVFTLGKNGNANNLLSSEEILRDKGIDFYTNTRGGDITYHGPGQIVGYPILDIERFGEDIKEYMRNLEEVVIRSLADFKIQGERIHGATGVWLDVNNNPRKIAALGVKTSRWVSMHGFALNVSTDLSYFDMIVPCGIRDKGVTSIEKELGHAVDKEVVKERLKFYFTEVFNCKLKEDVGRY